MNETNRIRMTFASTLFFVFLTVLVPTTVEAGPRAKRPASQQMPEGATVSIELLRSNGAGEETIATLESPVVENRRVHLTAQRDGNEVELSLVLDQLDDKAGYVESKLIFQGNGHHAKLDSRAVLERNKVESLGSFQLTDGARFHLRVTLR